MFSFAAPPKILSVMVEGSPESGFTALCRAQGSPLPDVQWAEKDVLLQGSEVAALTEGSHYHMVVRLSDVEPGMHYTCSATNPLGRDQAALFLLRPRAPSLVGWASAPVFLLLSLSLGSKVALLLGVGLCVIRSGTLQHIQWCWRK